MPLLCSLQSEPTEIQAAKSHKDFSVVFKIILKKAPEEEMDSFRRKRGSVCSLCMCLCAWGGGGGGGLVCRAHCAGVWVARARYNDVILSGDSTGQLLSGW